MITKQQRPLQVNSIHRPFFLVKCASRQARVSFLLCSLVPNLIRVQNIVHCVGCHPTKGHEVNFTLRVYFAPTNFTLSAYLASKHFGDSACFGSKNLRDSASFEAAYLTTLYCHRCICGVLVFDNHCVTKKMQ